MAQTVPTREPSSITAGDTLSWIKSLADYPANSGWTLKYRLINAAGRIDITGVAEGSDHKITVPAATSAAYAAGNYAWQAYVEGGTSERYTVGTGTLAVLPNLAALATGYDTRSTAAKTLAAVNAWLESKDLSVAEFQHNERSLKNIPITDLLKLRSRLQGEVMREESAARLAAGLPNKSRVLVRF